MATTAGGSGLAPRFSTKLVTSPKELVPSPEIDKAVRAEVREEDWEGDYLHWVMEQLQTNDEYDWRFVFKGLDEKYDIGLLNAPRLVREKLREAFSLYLPEVKRVDVDNDIYYTAFYREVIHLLKGLSEKIRGKTKEAELDSAVSETIKKFELLYRQFEARQAHNKQEQPQGHMDTMPQEGEGELWMATASRDYQATKAQVTKPQEKDVWHVAGGSVARDVGRSEVREINLNQYDWFKEMAEGEGKNQVENFVRQIREEISTGEIISGADILRALRKVMRSGNFEKIRSWEDREEIINRYKEIDRDVEKSRQWALKVFGIFLSNKSMDQVGSAEEALRILERFREIIKNIPAHVTDGWRAFWALSHLLEDKIFGQMTQPERIMILDVASEIPAHVAHRFAFESFTRLINSESFFRIKNPEARRMLLRMMGYLFKDEIANMTQRIQDFLGLLSEVAGSRDFLEILQKFSQGLELAGENETERSTATKKAYQDIVLLEKQAQARKVMVDQTKDNRPETADENQTDEEDLWFKRSEVRDIDLDGFELLKETPHDWYKRLPYEWFRKPPAKAEEERIKNLVDQIEKEIYTYTHSEITVLFKAFRALFGSDGFFRITNPKERIQVLEKFIEIIKRISMHAKKERRLAFRQLGNLLCSEGFQRVTDPKEKIKILQIVKKISVYAKINNARVFELFRRILKSEGFCRVRDFTERMKILEKYSELLKEIFDCEKESDGVNSMLVDMVGHFFLKDGFGQLTNFQEKMMFLEIVRVLLKKREGFLSLINYPEKALDEVAGSKDFSAILERFSQELELAGENESEKIAAAEKAYRNILLLAKQMEARQAKVEQDEPQGHTDTMPQEGEGELWMATTAGGSGLAPRFSTKLVTSPKELVPSPEIDKAVRAEVRQIDLNKYDWFNWFHEMPEGTGKEQMKNLVAQIESEISKHAIRNRITTLDTLGVFLKDDYFGQITDLGERIMCLEFLKEIPAYAKIKSGWIFLVLGDFLGDRRFNQITGIEKRKRIFEIVKFLVRSNGKSVIEEMMENFLKALNKVSHFKDFSEILEKFSQEVKFANSESEKIAAAEKAYQNILLLAKQAKARKARVEQRKQDAGSQMPDESQGRDLWLKRSEIRQGNERLATNVEKKRLLDIVIAPLRLTVFESAAIKFLKAVCKILHFAKYMAVGKLLSDFSDSPLKLKRYFEDKHVLSRIPTLKAFGEHSGITVSNKKEKAPVVLAVLHQNGENIEELWERDPVAMEDILGRYLAEYDENTLDALDASFSDYAARVRFENNINNLRKQLEAREAHIEQEQPQGYTDTELQEGEGELWMATVAGGSGLAPRSSTKLVTSPEELVSSPEINKAVRSEARIEKGVAEETVAVLLNSGKVQPARLDDLAQDIENTLKIMPLDQFAEVLRAEAVKQLALLETSAIAFETPKVDRALAEKATHYFVNKLVSANAKGDLAVAFDLSPDVNFQSALLQMRSKIGMAVFSKELAKGLDPKVFKGMPHQIVKDLNGLKLPLVISNDKAIPVIGNETSASSSESPALFGVRINASSIQGEPFLEVVEKVVQIASGILVADRINEASELKNSVKADEIKAELLKQLFEEQGAVGVITIRNGKIFVDRGLLRDFLIQYVAARSIQQAA